MFLHVRYYGYMLFVYSYDSDIFILRSRVAALVIFLAVDAIILPLFCLSLFFVFVVVVSLSFSS